MPNSIAVRVRARAPLSEVDRNCHTPVTQCARLPRVQTGHLVGMARCAPGLQQGVRWPGWVCQNKGSTTPGGDDGRPEQLGAWLDDTHAPPVEDACSPGSSATCRPGPAVSSRCTNSPGLGFRVSAISCRSQERRTRNTDLRQENRGQGIGRISLNTGWIVWLTPFSQRIRPGVRESRNETK